MAAILINCNQLLLISINPTVVTGAGSKPQRAYATADRKLRLRLCAGAKRPLGPALNPYFWIRTEQKYYIIKAEEK